MIESALDRLDAHRAQARRPYYLSLLAEIYSLLGNRARASSILDAAIATALERADMWWLPAMYLQKSELVPLPERDAIRSRGLELARAQNSRSLERRILASYPLKMRRFRERFENACPGRLFRTGGSS